ncbi:D-aminoacylase [uncultured Woeseiaceae bacterium]|uniref:D-aminoacylase n=1 Tax=uncultured Woeseiaceae bacterium TaxID=1983305 RepID=A0A7D9D253_9GAMM|nr:D-aminoacylase [uncultured Woeseiaceae bacterium]
MKKIALLAATLIVAACQPAAPPITQEDVSDKAFDILLTGGTVVDGLGTPRYQADVGIKGDRIVAISTDGLSADDAVVSVDVATLVISPGFIDNHAHIQTTIHEHPLAENFTRQGITTIIAGLHSGDQPWPLDEYASSLDVAPNVGFFAGHTWTRKQVLGLEDRAPDHDELQAMRDLVEETMQQGALGLSTGLLYVPANFAETEEVIELAKIASQYGGIYVTHMRNEGTGLIDSVNETIRIATEADIPAHINHHKAHGVGQWGRSVQSLALIDEARAAGIDITHDLYPYTASSTSSAILFPQWTFAGGPEEFAKRLTDPEQLPIIKEEMKRIFMQERTGDDLSRLQIRVLPSDESYNGKTLADMAADRGLPNNVDTGIDLVIELQLKGGFSAIYHAMDEQDVIRIMTHPSAMIETDGDPVSYGEGFPHPRSYGAFPRVLARYVRELGVLTLEQAIKKMTSMPADQYNQRDRGRIKEGAFADLVVFDPDTIQDEATYVDPHRYPTGIHHVMINGRFVIKSGALTGERPGVWIKGPARPERVTISR